jgi:hypothetical protein
VGLRRTWIFNLNGHGDIGYSFPHGPCSSSPISTSFHNLVLTSSGTVWENRHPVLEWRKKVSREHLERYWVKTVSSMQVTTGPSRRRTSRIPITANDVWVYWESPTGRDISRVRDLSPAGLFLETRARKREGELLNLHFLVQEGQIRAEAVVRHAAPGRGVGMKISSVPSQDAPHLHRLLTRLREIPKPLGAQPSQKS